MKRFSYLDRTHLLQELSGSLSQILCFTICISLYTQRDLRILRTNKEIRTMGSYVYHYCFLSSRAYQNRYQVLGITPRVPGFISWVVDLEALGPGSWIRGPEVLLSLVLGPGSWGLGFRILGAHFRLCPLQVHYFLILKILRSLFMKLRKIKHCL